MSYLPRDKKFTVNEIDDTTTADVTYIGKEAEDGEWWIVEIDDSGSTSTFQHATYENNGSVSPNNYDTAWAARATTLTYGNYNDAF